MALVVESTSIFATSNTTSLVITAPTGITAGELLIWVLFGDTPPTPSGWTSISVINSNVRTLYKIADSADAAASNFTATFGTANGAAAAMLRVSGWGTGNPVFNSNTVDSTFTAASVPATLGASGLSLARPAQQLLLLINAGFTNDDPSFTIASSAYSVTSGDANPTWTEVIDEDFISYGSGATDGFFSVAYATSTDTSTITAYSTTLTEVGFGTGTMDYSSQLFNLVSPNSPTPTVSPLAITPGTTSLTVTQVNVAPEVDHISAAPQINGAEAEATAPTQWVNEAAESTTWTNET